LTLPSDGEKLYSNPIFAWEGVSGNDNHYKVEMVYARGGPIYSSPVIANGTVWWMPNSTWNAIAPGRLVLWRVRGADLSYEPISVLSSDEVWGFYKY
jgi:hypothetical protein